MAEYPNQPQGDAREGSAFLPLIKLWNVIRWLFEPDAEGSLPQPNQQLQPLSELARATSLLEQQQEAIALVDSDIRSLLTELCSCQDAIGQLQQQYAQLRQEVDLLK